MTKVFYEFNGDQLTARFSGTGVEDESGAHVEDIKLEELSILGHTVMLETLPEALQASILALPYENDAEFDEEDSSDADDLDD